MENQQFNTTIAIIILATIPVAFILKPFKAGLDIYVYLGIACILAMFIMPFFHAAWSGERRLLFAFLLPIAEIVVWCIGFVLADFRILTRLF